MKLSTPFFTRKRIILVTTAVFGFYVSVWGFVLIGNKVERNKRISQIITEQSKFKSQSNEEQASLKAQEYLKAKVTYMQPSERIFLDYLQRKFNLDPKLGVEGSPFDVSKDPRIYPQDINYLYRIAYPEELVTQLPREKYEGPTLTNVFAANCDHLPLPNNFWQTMEDNFKAGGYYLTHDALAFAFIKDNGCQIPSSESDLANRVNEGMVALMDDKSTSPDLRYEIVAFLMLGGHYNQVNREWVEQIASEQREDGSWSEKAGDNEKSSYHATLLALWALLEFSHPNTPYEPLIHRPTQQP